MIAAAELRFNAGDRSPELESESALYGLLLPAGTTKRAAIAVAAPKVDRLYTIEEFDRQNSME